MDLEGTVAKTVKYIEEAAKEGARLLAFPETWVPGYPWHIWVGTPAWAIAKGFVQRYFDNSLGSLARFTGHPRKSSGWADA